MASVCFVLALCVEVKKHAGIGIIDRLDSDALSLVFVVFLVFVAGPKSPRAEPACYCLLESVVIGILRSAVLLVAAIEIVAGVGEAVVFAAVLRHEVHGDSIIPLFVDDSDHRQMNFIDLELGLVLVLLGQRPFPLCACNAVEAPILQALQALLSDC